MPEIVELRKHDYIDALRGYAVLGVIVVHAANLLPFASSRLQHLSSDGARGVQLFYVASALTLCMSWHARKAGEQAPLRNFFLRRVFRILPLFWLALAFYAALYGLAPRYWAPNGIAWWYLPLTATCLHGFHPEVVNSVVPGGWSIAVEMTFYLLLPGLLHVVRGPTRAALFFGLSLALYVASNIAIGRLLAPFYPAEQQYLVAQFRYLTIFGQLPVFAVGLGTFALLQRQQRSRFLLGAAGTLAYVVARVLVRTGSGKEALLGDHIVISVALAAFALLLSAWPKCPLINGPVVWLGRLSFSMYLAHFAVLELLGSLLPYVPARGDAVSALLFLATVALTAVLARATYQLVELPGIALGRRVIARLEQPRGAPAANPTTA